MRSREQAPIALRAPCVLLSQDHVHYWIGHRIPNAKDTMIVRVTHPQKLSAAHGRYPKNRASQGDLFPRSKYWESGFSFPNRM